MSALIVGRDLVVAHGKDTMTFLQGQLSQDVVGMAVGTTRLTFHLTPQGRLIALARVTRLADDEVVIDTDAGAGEAVRANLQRFKIRTACDLDLIEGVTARRVPGDADRSAAMPPAADVVAGAAFGVETFPGVAWTDVVGGGASGSPALSDDALIDRWRAEHGVPAFGHEIEERWLPPETGLLDLTVAFGKGCYVGQELVERIDARGRVNRILCALRFSGGSTPAAGAVRGADIVRADTGATVGTVTTAAGDLGLGYVRVDAIASELRMGDDPGAPRIVATPARPDR